MLRTKEVPLVKVLLQYHNIKEVTWETEEWMRQLFQGLFANTGMNFKDKIVWKGECETPKIFRNH